MRGHDEEAFPAASTDDSMVGEIDAGHASGHDAGATGASKRDDGADAALATPPEPDAAIAHDAAATDPNITPDTGAPDPTPVMDASVEDAQVEPEPDAEPIDSGKPACPCICPHELLDSPLPKPAADECKPVTCSLDACTPDPDCGFVMHGMSGYYVCDTEREWTDAQQRCSGIPGAQLASIENQKEDDFLFALLSDKTWVGGSDLQQEGVFRWETGTIFWRGGAEVSGGGGGSGPGPGQPGGGPAAGKYANFLSYEPNDEGLDNDPGDCVLLWPDQDGWADGSCGDQHGYVCEFPVAPAAASLPAR